MEWDNKVTRWWSKISGREIENVPQSYPISISDHDVPGSNSGPVSGQGDVTMSSEKRGLVEAFWPIRGFQGLDTVCWWLKLTSCYHIQVSRTDPLASLGQSLRLFTAESWDGANVTLECPEMTKVSQSEPSVNITWIFHQSEANNRVPWWHQGGCFCSS